VLYLLLVAAGFSLFASIFLSIAEGGLIHFSRTRLDERVKDKMKLAGILQLLEERDRLLLATVALDAAFNVLFVIFITVYCVETKEPLSAALLEAFIWAVGGVVIGAEIIPRTWSSRRAESALAGTIRTVSFLAGVLKYPLAGLELISEVAGRLTGAPAEDRETEDRLEEQILSAVSGSPREGEIIEQQKEMLEGIVTFRNAHAAKVMTPRTEMASIEVAAPLHEAVKLALEKGHSRLPVFEGNRDNVIGVMHVRDVLRFWGTPAEEATALRDVVRKPMFVPETKKVMELLHEMRSQRTHMAIVLDEYGGTAGLVTIEDILEEIVGDIEDEFDRAAELRLRRIDARTIEVDAKVRVDEVNEALGTNLPEDESYETIGGFVFSHIGRIPAPGDAFRHDAVQFSVLDADERRVKVLRISVPQRAGDG